MDTYARDPRKVEQALFDTLYEERLRLRTEKDKDEVKSLVPYYKKIYSRAPAKLPPGSSASCWES